ncbi:Phosphotransferase enzyme [Aspergillus nanangensis]|uniref:Phosphotransferase enzyme n=1 Tax=Aspergillus nanangensis TaxID=2582783 RepID=A0AAD4CRM2_ASPNN|nr:Phosphotransferase enzyme [Aspergillus nanangensis]
MPTPVPIRDDETGAYNMRDLDGLEWNTGGDEVASGSVPSNGGAPSSPPIQYSDGVVQETLDLDSRQREADIVMEQMRHALGVDVLGWVSNSEYEAVKELAGEMKARMLEAAKTAEGITGVRDHFPFDDFDEST